MNSDNNKEDFFDEKSLSLNTICDMDDTLSQTLVEEKLQNLSDDMKSRMNPRNAERCLQSCRTELQTSQANLQSVEAMNSFLMDSLAIILYDLDAESNNFLNPEHITGIELIKVDEPLKSDILLHQEILKESLLSDNENGVREKIQDYKKNISALENSLEILENRLSKIGETNAEGIIFKPKIGEEKEMITRIVSQRCQCVEHQEELVKLNKAKVDMLRKSRESAKELRNWKTDYYLDLNKTTKMFTKIQIEMQKAIWKHEKDMKVWQRKIERRKSLNARAQDEYDRYEAKCKQQVHSYFQDETHICTANDEQIKFWLEHKLAKLFSFIDNKVFLEKIKTEYQDILSELESLHDDTTEVDELILKKISKLNIELQYRHRQINDLETTITENTFEVLKKDICDKMQTQIESRLILQNMTKAMTELAKTFETSKLNLVKEKHECELGEARLIKITNNFPSAKEQKRN